MKTIEEVFYDKKLSDAIRHITKNSHLPFNCALMILEESNNFQLDIRIITKLSCAGISSNEIKKIIIILNK